MQTRIDVKSKRPGMVEISNQEPGRRRFSGEIFMTFSQVPGPRGPTTLTGKRCVAAISATENATAAERG